MTERTAVNERASGAGISAAFHRYWYPLMALVRRDVKKRYVTSMLGVAWTVLQPLILLAVYVAVFGFILRSGRTADDARLPSLERRRPSGSATCRCVPRSLAVGR